MDAIKLRMLLDSEGVLSTQRIIGARSAASSFHPPFGPAAKAVRGHATDAADVPGRVFESGQFISSSGSPRFRDGPPRRGGHSPIRFIFVKRMFFVELPAFGLYLRFLCKNESALLFVDCSTT